MKKHGLILGALILIFFSLLVVRTFISNNVSTSGVALGKIQEEIDNYKIENSILSQQVYSYSSLSNIALKASQLGFVEDNQKFVLSNSVPIAVKQ